MIIEYQGNQVYYTASGTGNPIVLLHGFLETSKIWEPFLEDLVTKRQVVCIDLPGHGNTGIFGEIHPMEMMAEVVNAVLEELHIPKATFMGHSMGGYVSLAFAEKYPGKITGMALLNSTPEADSDEKRTIRDKSARLIRKNKKAYINMALTNLVAPGNEITFYKELEKLKLEAYKFPSKGIIANLIGMKIRTDRKNILRQLTSYKIMIFGIKDPIISLNTANMLTILCKCPVKIIEGGHLSYLENDSNVREHMHFID